MRSSAGLSSRAIRTPSEAKRPGVLSKIADFARRAAGILGLSAGVGIAAATPSPQPELPSESVSVSAPSAPKNPVPAKPNASVSTELREREWKTVVQKGIGARDFAMKAFGTDDWRLLIDEEGNRLADPSKLRFGRRYLVAQNPKDAATVASAVRSMGRMDLSPRTAPKASAAAVPKLSVSDFVSNAEEHLGKPYRLGGNGKKTMDCSQLVVESLKTAGVVSESFDTTAAGFHSMSSKKKLGEVQKGDLLFWHNKRGHVTHVAIALSAPDQKGYVEIIDASASKKSVAKRKFHTSLAGLSAGYLPFVGTPASDPLPVYAQAAPKSAATPVGPMASALPALPKASAPAASATPLAVAKAAPTPKAAASKVSVSAESAPKTTTVPTRLAKATVVDFPAQVSQAVQISHPAPSFQSENVRPAVFVQTDSARTPVQKVESRVSAKVVDLTSRIADAKTAESVRESLSKRSIAEQIDYYRAQAEASNDPSFSVTASKLELVKLHGERKLVSENIARYKEQAAKSVPGAFETVVKLNKVASILDQKIGTLALALNEGSPQVRRAA